MYSYPTDESREVYRNWKGADSKENVLELQLGIRHPTRDKYGRLNGSGDGFKYIDGEFE
jgi:hypothetical protein